MKDADGEACFMGEWAGGPVGGRTLLMLLLVCSVEPCWLGVRVGAVFCTGDMAGPRVEDGDM